MLDALLLVLLSINPSPTPSLSSLPVCSSCAVNKTSLNTQRMPATLWGSSSKCHSGGMGNREQCRDCEKCRKWGLGRCLVVKRVYSLVEDLHSIPSTKVSNSQQFITPAPRALIPLPSTAPTLSVSLCPPVSLLHKK